MYSEELDFYELNESRQWPIKGGEYSNMKANEESSMGNLEPGRLYRLLGPIKLPFIEF